MIKPKEGHCIDCERLTKLIARRCQQCYWNYRRKVNEIDRVDKSTNFKQNRIYNIPKYSAKRKAQNVLYLKKRCNFMEQNKTCQAKLSGCSYWATELHHKKGRSGDLLTDERFFLSVCRKCHQVIEENPELAKEKGLSLNRLDIFSP